MTRQTGPRRRTASRKRSGAAGPQVNSRNVAQNRARSKAQEAFIAEHLGGRVVPGSGALGEVGDVRVERGPLPILVECKLSKDRTFRLDLAAIEQLSVQADAEGLTPALALRIEAATGDVEHDWLAVPLRVFVSLLRRSAK